jgi:dephospho-CoA kinase
MLRIGVTGLMASGKSTVARRFEERGAVRIDGDVLGQETIRVPEIRSAIAAEFGPSVIGADGAVDRVRLGALVFGDARAMDRLNRIVQPALLGRVRRELENGTPGPAGVLVLDAALISTWRIEGDLDLVVEVVAPEAVRVERLARARKYSPEEALSRIRGQTLPPLRGAKRLLRIDNDGDVAALRAHADRIWEEIVKHPSDASKGGQR